MVISIQKAAVFLVMGFILIISSHYCYAFFGDNGVGYGSYPNNLVFPYYVYSSVLSQPLNVLPQGYVTIIIGGETYYYSRGTFYQKNVREQKYLVVPPPVGAVIYSIPEGYRLVSVDGMTYYEYNGVYYKRVLEGYRVITPPIIAM